MLGRLPANRRWRSSRRFHTMTTFYDTVLMLGWEILMFHFTHLRFGSLDLFSHFLVSVDLACFAFLN